MIKAQQILDNYGITETSSKGIKRQADALEPKKHRELVDELALALMGMSYRIGNSAYEGIEDRDSRGQGMALISLLALLEPHHPFVGSA